MCEFCTKHGDGEIWYKNAKNYSDDLMSDLKRRQYINEFLETTMGNGITTIGRLETIFRKRKKLPPPIVKTMVDKAREEHFGQVVPIEEDEGNIDRYVLSKRLVIERRTGGVFIKGIMEKTLFTSAIYMREHFANPVLIVEGGVNYDYTGFDSQAIRGALSSMMLLYEVNVVSTPDVDETVELIAIR